MEVLVGWLLTIVEHRVSCNIDYSLFDTTTLANFIYELLHELNLMPTFIM